MKIVGLVMARNCEEAIERQLSEMKEYCDAVVALDDRSTDLTFQLLRCNPVVSQARKLEAIDTTSEWYFRESVLLNLLYEMAEQENPSWIIRLDSDERLAPGNTLRRLLSLQPVSVVAVRLQRHSVWSDPLYPDMVPIMGSATSWQGAVWRALPGLAAKQPMHNPRLPAQMGHYGSIVFADSPTVLHTGWDTLTKRINKVEIYQSLDPMAAWNHGVEYDRGLLFGYSISEIDALLEEYRRRMTVGAS